MKRLFLLLAFTLGWSYVMLPHYDVTLAPYSGINAIVLGPPCVAFLLNFLVP